MGPFWHIRISERSLRRPPEVHGLVADIEQSVSRAVSRSAVSRGHRAVLGVGPVRGAVTGEVYGAAVLGVASRVCLGKHAESCALACRNRDAESCLWGPLKRRTEKIGRP